MIRNFPVDVVGGGGGGGGGGGADAPPLSWAVLPSLLTSVVSLATAPGALARNSLGLMTI
jgi:hypothetical protein